MLDYQQLCMFGNLVVPDKWIKTAAFRLHTHDILCSAVTLLKNNRTALYNTIPAKQVSRFLQAAEPPTPVRDTDPVSKKQKLQSGEALPVAQVQSQSLSSQASLTSQASQTSH